MAGSGDEQLSTKLEHLIESTKNQVEVTSNEAFQKALHEGHERCKAAKVALDQAVKAVDDDKIENSAAALAFSGALKAAIDELEYVCNSGRNRLLYLRPAERDAVGEVELKRRRDFIEMSLDVSPSKLTVKGRTAVKNKLDTVYERLSGAPDYFPPEELVTFKEKLDLLAQAYETVIAEGLDDQPLMITLEESRDLAESRHVAMRELLAGILRFEQKPPSVDEFILKIRRRAAEDEEDPTEPVSPEPTPEGS